LNSANNNAIDSARLLKWISGQKREFAIVSPKAPSIVIGDLNAAEEKYLDLGCIHKIWKKLPNELVQKGAKDGWLKIKKSCTISITKGLKIKK
jgi:hypothetical protein